MDSPVVESVESILERPAPYTSPTPVPTTQLSLKSQHVREDYVQLAA